MLEIVTVIGTAMTEIETVLSVYTRKFNQKLETYFPVSEAPEQKAVAAMRYSILNGGKRLRPFLLHETAGLFGMDYETAFPVAASLEMLHTYSLIHDDLPAMDNDDLRRGKPTCHRAFDEATAILAGDGLLTYAFEILNTAPVSDAKKVELTLLLSRAAGAFNGMISGQVLDLYSLKASRIGCGTLRSSNRNAFTFHCVRFSTVTGELGGTTVSICVRTA